MTADAAVRSYVPAYVPSDTFITFIKGFEPTVAMPDHIDKSLMPSMSGGMQNHLIASLKFLGLIEDNGRVTPRMRELIDSTAVAEQFNSNLKDMLNDAYASILGRVSTQADLARITPAQLREKLRGAGATGSTNSKAMRFYLKTLKAAGIETPKHLSQRGTAPTARREADENGQPKVRKPRAKTSTGSTTADKGHDDHGNMRTLPVFLEGRVGKVVFPPDITKDECDKYDAAVKYLRELAK